MKCRGGPAVKPQRQRYAFLACTPAGGMFFADISLPLRGAAAKLVTQDGAQCNIIQAG